MDSKSSVPAFVQVVNGNSVFSIRVSKHEEQGRALIQSFRRSGNIGDRRDAHVEFQTSQAQLDQHLEELAARR